MNPSENTEPKKKKERSGRWSQAETDLFEILIQHYGKNWRKIKEAIKGRSLSQIRSHAQKFFTKVGPEKTLEYENKAKLL